MRFVHAYTTFNIFNILFVNKLIQKINHLFGKNNKNKIYKNQILELKRTYTKDKKECNILLIVNK
ncbi:MAG: hypothetical protein QM532_03205 [Cyanobium sp. MAG06]|nr:hypothetical protein [Cyanobium sp. MAG06]